MLIKVCIFILCLPQMLLSVFLAKRIVTSVLCYINLFLLVEFHQNVDKNVVSNNRILKTLAAKLSV